MVKHAKGLDETFAALADPTRREILVALADDERTLSDLAEPFEMSLPAIFKHVAVLERAGLVSSRREGRVRRCRLEREPLAAAMRWIADYGRFWEESFDSLERLLAKQTKGDR